MYVHVSLVPRPLHSFCRMQYGKCGSLGTRLHTCTCCNTRCTYILWLIISGVCDTTSVGNSCGLIQNLCYIIVGLSIELLGVTKLAR